jgi:hypothetical protein
MTGASLDSKSICPTSALSLGTTPPGVEQSTGIARPFSRIQ